MQVAHDGVGNFHFGAEYGGIQNNTDKLKSLKESKLRVLLSLWRKEEDGMASPRNINGNEGVSSM